MFTASRHPKYRPDIDGLRAIAVLSVVVFHAFPAAIPGGFIGVDIFFVISGYLISTILLGGLEQGRFSIVDFYDRRIRRIFPALLTVLIVTLAIGWYLLLAEEYAQLGEHIAGGAAFVSNVLLWGESGYFDTAAESKVLLHLWSLAIEEQFYIFWPLLLAFVWRRKWSFLRIIAVIGLLSFAANIYLIGRNPSAAFYWPVSRFWELMIGGALAYMTLHRPDLIARHKNVQSAAGFAMLLAGLVLIDRHRAFPSWWALLPTVGTFLMISAGPQAWLNRAVLSRRALVWVGLISYPLYLWHWPLLTYAHITTEESPPELRAMMVAAAFGLAWITLRFIEQPLRFARGPATAFGMLGALVLIGGAGFGLWRQGGMEGYGFRSGERAAYSDYFDNSLPEWRYFEREGIPAKFNDQCNFYDLDSYRHGHANSVPVSHIAENCYTRDPARSRAVMIWGDSHAQQMYFGVSSELPGDWQVLQVASSGCAPRLDAKASASDYCSHSNWFAYKTIAEVKPDVVVMAQNENHDPAAMHQIAARLKGVGVKRVVWLGPTPHWMHPLPKIVMRSLWHDTPHRTFVGAASFVLQVDVQLKESFKSPQAGEYLSIIDYFCGPDGCQVYLGDDRKAGVTAFDYGHLTPIASHAFAKDVLVPAIVANRS